MFLKKIIFLFVTFLPITISYCQQKDFVITDYGAKSDGVTNNVNAIQHAIDDAFNNGGGRVVIPSGQFLSGVIHLKSNVELFIDEKAVLLASTNRADYGLSLKASAFIVAENAKNISLKGNGNIDGQCDLLMKDIYKKLRSRELNDNEWKEFNPWHQRRPSEANRPAYSNLKIGMV